MKNRFRIRVAIAFATLMAIPFAASVAQAGNSPLVTAVQTLDASPSSGANGYIDRVEVSFNQAMQTSQPVIAADRSSPGFWVEGYSITGFQWSGSPATKLVIFLAEGATYDTHVTPLVTYNPGAGSADVKTSLGVSDEAWDTVAVDKAGAVLIGVTAKDYGANALFSHPGDEMFLRFTEPVSVTGGTPADRWSNLERAITFTVSGGTACQDGLGVITDRNFPRPQTATDDPILSPLSGERSDVVHVRYLAGNQASNSTHMIPGIPAGCKLGIHGNYNVALLDAASAPAAPLTDNARKLFVHPADASLVSATTLDGVGAARDGMVDGVRLRFDLPIDDATVGAHLGDFAVALEGETASIASFATGAAANDGSIDLLLASQTWGGGQTPRVSYARHSSCAATSSGSVGTGVKALIFPLGTAHRACLGSFDRRSTDGVGPVILSAATRDVDGNGLLDAAIVTLTESVTGSAAGWTVGDSPATSFNPSGATATIGFAETAMGTGETPAVAYATPASDPTVDANGIGVAPASVQASDGAAPLATGVTVLDTDADGNIETADFVFSETVSTDAPGAFSVGGTSASEVVGLTTETVRIRIAGLTGSAARAAAFTATDGAVLDAAGLAAGSRAFTAASVTDGAAPVGAIQIAPNAPVGPGTTTIRGRFSELMDAATAPVVTFAGRSVSGSWTEAGDTWEGSIEIQSTDCEIATGCEVAAVIEGAKDARLNAQAAPISRTTEIDTIAPAAPTGLTFAAAGAPSGYVNRGSTTLTLSLSTAGDAVGGTAELLLDGASFPSPATGDVNGSDAEITKTFASGADLAEQISEGAHEAQVRLCDDALNCVTAAAASFTADFTPVAAEITTEIPAIVSGGSSLDLSWGANGTGEDATDVTLESSTDGGSTFSTVASAQPADGSAAWSVPTVDVSGAILRLRSTDAAGNVYTFATQGFTIDSTAPAVEVTAPSSRRPFLGSSTLVRWTATDVSETSVSIEYTTNNGSSWAPINGGSYSKSNDGVETWRIPNVRSFNVRVRVRGTDETGRSTQVVTGRFATGVRGFVADRSGTVYGFGLSSTGVRESMVSSRDVARGIAVRSDRRTGYVLRKDGRVFPFAGAGASMPPRRSSPRFRGDLARGIVLQTDTRGYIVDAYGRVYPFGGAPRAYVSRTWVGRDLARGIVMRADKRGGYVLDAYGRLHPFKLTTYAWPPRIQNRAFSSRRAVGVVLYDNQRSGIVLENTGRLIRFGGAPRISNPYISSRAGARGIVPISDTGGYWVDGRGIMRRYGDAFGSPTRLALRSGRARGAAG